MKRLLKFVCGFAVALSFYFVREAVCAMAVFSALFSLVTAFLLVCAAIGHGIESLADAVARFFGRGREFNTEGVLWRL